jgi:AraC-like DNA-binding protein
LTAAHNKIRHGGMSISGACFETKYRNPSHFSGLFKHRFGYAQTKQERNAACSEKKPPE